MSRQMPVSLTSTPNTRFVACILLMLTLGSSNLNAEPDFIGGDLGLPSTTQEASDSLIDADAVSEASSPNLSPADAAERVRRSMGGQIINVNTIDGDHGVVYGVKVLNAGRMKVVNVDGQTGQLLNNE